jgi:transcription initiation factor TFIIIB Brf1 subunit/transcription initiation factor TFIIB
MEFTMARFRPSQIALSAIYLSNKFLKFEKWRAELPNVIGCTEQEIKNCALDLFLLVHKVKKSNLSAIIRRFASEKHMGVSQIQIKL